MKPRSLKSGLGLGALLLLVMASVQRGSPARAAPPSAGGEVARSDQRVPAAAQLVRGLVRKAVVCGSPLKHPFVGGVLSILSVRGVLDDALATELACAIDAPAGATCETMQRCSGELSPAADKPTCDGDVLRARDSSGRGHAVSCAALGERCFQTSLDAMCGSGPCGPDETYRCEQDTVSACVSGVRVQHACGLGFTCGRTRGNKIIDCIGAAGASCTQERCEGQVAVSCVTDAFGGATERRVDCAELGLQCQGVTKGSEVRARCLPPKTPTNALCQGSGIECSGKDVKVCGGDKPYVFSCADLGTPGSCTPVAQDIVRCQ
jgi:hypothetical protein